MKGWRSSSGVRSVLLVTLVVGAVLFTVGRLGAAGLTGGVPAGRVGTGQVIKHITHVVQ